MAERKYPSWITRESIDVAMRDPLVRATERLMRVASCIPGVPGRWVWNAICEAHNARFVAVMRRAAR